MLIRVSIDIIITVLETQVTLLILLIIISDNLGLSVWLVLIAKKAFWFIVYASPSRCHR